MDSSAQRVKELTAILARPFPEAVASMIVSYMPINNIEVFVRARPLLSIDTQIPNNHTIVKIDPDNVTCEVQDDNRVLPFEFDRIFQHENTEEVYNKTTSKLVNSLFEGNEVALLTYGANKSGKTYSMRSEDGIIERAICDVFNHIGKRKCKDVEYSVEISYVTIYRERIKDLLCPERSNIRVRWRPDEVSLQGAAKTMLENEMEGIQAKKTGDLHFLQYVTQMSIPSNQCSLVFIIYLKQTNILTDELNESKFMLIENKSSERATGACGDRIAIHTRHDALVNVVKALMRNKRFAPYRDSQITHLLRKCLSGEGKICILVTISPCKDGIRETISSLRFGKCCMKIEYERKL